MKKFLLLSSTAAMLIWSNYVNAACVSTPSCTTLGYDSKTPCSNGGIKCPFGEAWNCKISELKDKITELEKEIEVLEEKNNTIGVCNVGDYLYSDMSCDPYLHTDECPIGIVVDGINNIAISKDTFKYNSNYPSESYFFAPGQNIDLTNSGIPAPKYPILDFNGKKNTYDLYNYCKKNNLSCPFLEKVANYSIGNTSPGDWYIPAYGELGYLSLLSPLIHKKLVYSGCEYSVPYDDNPYNADPVWSSTISYPNKAANDIFETYSVTRLFGNGYSIYKGISTSPLDTSPSEVVMLVQFTPKKKEVDDNRDCQIGDILFADKTCSNIVGGEKTPIGVVVDPEKRKAVGLSDSPVYSKSECDLPDICNLTENEYEDNALNDMNGKQNTNIMYQCVQKNSLNYALISTTVKYKTEGTKEGDWYIPSLGEFSQVVNNTTINHSLSLAGGEFADSEDMSGITGYCSSTYYRFGKFWATSASGNYITRDCSENCQLRLFIQY